MHRRIGVVGIVYGVNTEFVGNGHFLQLQERMHEYKFQKQLE